MTWTQKEKNFLKDLQSEEKLCAEKYHKAAEAACDGTLKQILQKIEKAEQGHCDTVTGMLAGTMPAPQSQGKAQAGRARSAKSLKAKTTRAQKQSDAYLLADLLATEKYVAGVYNTAVFEFNDPAARQVLAGIQIQQAAQNPGRDRPAYMQANARACCHKTDRSGAPRGAPLRFSMPEISCTSSRWRPSRPRRPPCRAPA